MKFYSIIAMQHVTTAGYAMPFLRRNKHVHTPVPVIYTEQLHTRSTLAQLSQPPLPISLHVEKEILHTEPDISQRSTQKAIRPGALA